jgi:peptidoglycan/LPS O-acetylase OafA/YrhL
MMLVIIGTLELGWVRRLLSGRAIGWVGRLAYSLFLWHLPVKTYLPLESVPTLWLRSLVRLAISLVVATVNFYVLEQPARKWIVARFGDRARRPSASPSASGAASA